MFHSTYIRLTNDFPEDFSEDFSERLVTIHVFVPIYGLLRRFWRNEDGDSQKLQNISVI